MVRWIKPVGMYSFSRHDMEHSMLDLAAAQGYCDAIRKLLARGADVNAAGSTGRTALHCAAFQDEAAAVDVLITYGARLDAADHEGCTALHVASANGACEAIVSLLRHGAARTKLNGAGRSPLLVAVENSRLAAATLLLHASEEEENDEDFVDRRYGSDEYSALDLAARGGHTEVCQMIVRHGADVNAQDSDGVGALYLAALNDRVETVDLLVNAGADVAAQARGRENRTALHVACEEGSSGAVEALLRHGAGLFTRDTGHRTPLHLAARKGDEMTVELLLAWGADPTFGSVTHGYKFTALDEASYWGHVGVVRMMCNCATTQRGTDATREMLERIRRRDLAKSISAAVSIAAQQNQASTIDALVEAGGDVNAERGLCGTAIHYAAETGADDAIASLTRHGANVNNMGGLWHEVGLNKFKGKRRTALHTVALFGWASAAEALLTAGANPNLRCRFGDQNHYRPLDIATEEGHVEVMKLMIMHGVNLDGTDPRKGRTALHVAAASGRVEAIRVLTRAGCSLDVRDSSNGTPLHTCVAHSSCAAVAALAAVGADLNKASAEGDTPLHLGSSAARSRLDAVKALLAAGVDTGARNHEGSSALDLAAKAGHVALIEALIGGGADVNSMDGDGRTALMFAVEANRASAVDALLTAGADAEAHLHGETWTSLHAAAEDTQAEVVQVLLRHGANVHAEDVENDNDTPLHVAVRQAGMEGAFEIVKALLRYDADEEARNDNGLTPLGVVGSMGGAAAARAVTALLRCAPGDRAWRRRGLLILCCAHAKRTTSSDDALRMSASPKEEHAPKQPKIVESRAELAGFNTVAGGKGDGVGEERGTPGGGGAGAAAAAGASDKFGKVASWLLDLQEEGLFRIVVSYL